MKCGQCNGDDTKVIESRDVDTGQAVRRRRACVLCGHRFTTYERLERPQLVVIKNDGTRNDVAILSPALSKRAIGSSGVTSYPSPSRL